jgi:hypothetical protein
MSPFGPAYRLATTVVDGVTWLGGQGVLFPASEIAMIAPEFGWDGVSRITLRTGAMNLYVETATLPPAFRMAIGYATE